jgi:hypothetical protein
MGMIREDSFYEPDDYDDRSDEIEERTWELMKKDFNPKTSSAVAEALSELDVDTANSLQNAIDSNNYEYIGRKIMSIAFDYMESFAKEAAENEILD